MTIVLPTVAVAFAAFCVWLTVRIVNRRERWAKWTLAAVVLMAYPFSYGPVHRLDYMGWIPYELQTPVYYFCLPLEQLDKSLFDDPTPFPRTATPLERYQALWVEDLSRKHRKP